MEDKEMIFKKDLKTLLEKHHVKIIEHIKYDDDENILGMTHSIEGPGIKIFLWEMEGL